MFGSSLGQLGRWLAAGDLELGEVGAGLERAAQAEWLDPGGPSTKVVRAMQQGST
jgi:hypothetical protein